MTITVETVSEFNGKRIICIIARAIIVEGRGKDMCV